MFYVAKDPINWTLAVPEIQKPYQLPCRIVRRHLPISLEVSLLNPNPFGDEFQHGVGGFYHVMKIFNY